MQTTGRLKAEDETKRAVRTEDLNNQLESFEREIILATLQKTGGNQLQAAKLPGVAERTLRYKLKKLKLR